MEFTVGVARTSSQSLSGTSFRCPPSEDDILPLRRDVHPLVDRWLDQATPLYYDFVSTILSTKIALAP